MTTMTTMPQLAEPQLSPSERDAQIEQAQRRVYERMLADPDKARSTLVTSGRVADGLTCEVTQGKFSTAVDLGRAMGGDASAPPPGFFARAAIAACVAMAIKMHATRKGLRLRAVSVDVETDFDDAALYGIGRGSAAPLETRIYIDVDTDASQSLVRQLVDTVLEMDPWFLALRDPQVVIPRLSITSTPTPSP